MQRMAGLQSFMRALVWSILPGLEAGTQAAAQVQPADDAARGKAFFQLTCAICHTTSLGPGNTVIVKQGPSLVGVTGRRVRPQRCRAPPCRCQSRRPGIAAM